MNTTAIPMMNYHRLRMDVEKTVAADDFSVGHNVDGIVRELYAHGFDSPEALADNNDPDLFWAIVANHEAPVVL